MPSFWSFFGFVGSLHLSSARVRTSGRDLLLPFAVHLASVACRKSALLVEVGSQKEKPSSQQVFWHFDFFFLASCVHLLLHFFFCFFVLHFLILIPAFLQSMSMRTLHKSSSGGGGGDGGDGGDGGSGSHKPQVFLHFLHCLFLHCFAVLHFFLHVVEVSTHDGDGGGGGLGDAGGGDGGGGGLGESGGGLTSGGGLGDGGGGGLGDGGGGGEGVAGGDFPVATPLVFSIHVW